MGSISEKTSFLSFTMSFSLEKTTNKYLYYYIYGTEEVENVPKFRSRCLSSPGQREILHTDITKQKLCSESLHHLLYSPNLSSSD